MFIRLVLFLLLLLTSCVQQDVKNDELPPAGPSAEEQVQDTMHVATLYGSSSYFNFRGDEIMGYDYDLVNHFAEFSGVPVKIHLADSREEMLNMLRHNRIDLIAYSMYETKALKDEFDFVAFQEDSYMVLVQEIGMQTVSDINELKGKTVHVIKNSVYHQRMQHLNRELGGGIDIQLLDDTVSVDQAIEMVTKRKISYTIAHYKTAVQHKDFNRRLDCRIPVGFMQRNGWLVNKQNDKIKEMIADWENSSETELIRSQLYGKYLIKNPYFVTKKIAIPKGAISPYDAYFRKYAAEINWDWRLLAALAFHESRFDSSQVSRRGASGLMQLMPRTAAKFGLNMNDILNPEKNIEASVQYIKSLNLLFRKIENQEERKKFILASYNSGPAHILDAMALAEKHGKNPYIWFEHVEYFLSKKHEPEYYNDEVVKYGRFRSGETIRYVRNTLDTYQKYKGKM
ncbi:Membrane-bound lytic murein transglycosylase F [bioreactor metagenome]|jgi:membrane-bound lytic murein transglycosylase F|uniref:Membrane-bound lytic murein transglycosylase F n=1 Tax=bioreactor metagenome TaxID=1076179 RepID=A0A644WJA4_9ZZZZ|nr:transglycosylase SLT domain-containing protein [Paludibacter sp.]